MKASTKRRWIYIVSIALILCCVLLFFSPKTTTARIALAIAPADVHNDVASVAMTVPTECMLQTVYLRGNKNVPREGELMTLIINGEKISVANFGSLPNAKGEQIPDFENKLVQLDFKKLSKEKNLVITYENLHPAVKRNDLELVVEIVGEDEVVKNWNSFIKLNRRHLDTPKPAVPEKNSNTDQIPTQTPEKQSAAEAEKKAPETAGAVK